jgi:hypothetical protein
VVAALARRHGAGDADARHHRQGLHRRGRLLRRALGHLVRGHALDGLGGSLGRVADRLELEERADGIDRTALL